MLETVDLDAKLSKSEFKEHWQALDLKLGQLQRDLRARGIPVILVFEGWEASGVGTAISRLLAPLDPRGYTVHNFGPPTELESLYPPLWRYWRTLPARGAFAVYDGSWYGACLGNGKTPKLKVYNRIRTFERQLADDGAVILKFWLHIGKSEQARRFKKMEKDPALAWKVTPDDWARHRAYEAYCTVVEKMLAGTSAPYAPWSVVPAENNRYALAQIGDTVVAALEAALRRKPAPASPLPKHARRGAGPLDRVDLDRSLDRKAYDRMLPRLQKELLRLEHLIHLYRIPVVVVYEGWDASGKGGNIKRLVVGLDHRGFEVVPVGPPEGDEKTHHYLWRFWRNMPKAGHLTLFDRSWYGRVLVERIEGYATQAEWHRAYNEINEFEAELAAYGTVLVKFWIHISKREQIQRFRLREATPFKHWKITPDDWRNRRKWDAYYAAVSEMIELTSTVHGPWTIIEGEDKLFARIKALKTVIAAVAAALDAAGCKKVRHGK